MEKCKVLYLNCPINFQSFLRPLFCFLSGLSQIAARPVPRERTLKDSFLGGGDTPQKTGVRFPGLPPRSSVQARSEVRLEDGFETLPNAHDVGEVSSVDVL